jgi:hypothetical protein
MQDEGRREIGRGAATPLGPRNPTATATLPGSRRLLAPAQRYRAETCAGVARPRARPSHDPAEVTGLCAHTALCMRTALCAGTALCARTTLKQNSPLVAATSAKFLSRACQGMFQSSGCLFIARSACIELGAIYATWLAGSAIGGTSICSRTFGHSIRRSCPFMSSTSEVQLSTQSPSLQYRMPSISRISAWWM